MRRKIALLAAGTVIALPLVPFLRGIMQPFTVMNILSPSFLVALFSSLTEVDGLVTAVGLICLGCALLVLACDDGVVPWIAGLLLLPANVEGLGR